MAHRVTTETRGERTVHVLHDDASGASASVLPSFGFNLFDLRLPVAGKVMPVLDAFPDFAENPRSPGRNGIPVLFPFPNRVANAKYAFGGKDYSLAVNSGAHAIHGFAIAAAWDVVDQSTTGGAASITGRFQISKNNPAALEHWPTDAAIQITYRLADRRLTMEVSISNPTNSDLPYGFGIHPYFRCPLAPDGDPANTRVIVPASKLWVLEGFIPTGEQRPVDARLDFRKGQPMQGLKLDDVLTGLEFDGGHATCRVQDLGLKSEFRMIVDKNIRELVVYTPPGDGRTISIEPYTQTTDAVNLAARGVDGGLRVLKHGQTDALTILMETAEL